MNESFASSLFTFRKNDDHVLFYKLEEKKMPVLEVTDYIRIDSKLHVQTFFKGALVQLPKLFRQEIIVCMLKNIPDCLQSQKKLHCSVFEEIHEHSFFFFLKKKKEFIQAILYGAHYYLDIHQYSLTKCYWKISPYHLCLY